MESTTISFTYFIHLPIETYTKCWYKIPIIKVRLEAYFCATIVSLSTGTVEIEYVIFK